jgi:hypothetical protein
MGIFFVLIIWMILLGLLGVPFAGILAYWSWRNSRITGVPSRGRAAMAGLLPFVLIPVGLIWFFAYAIYCGTVRNVDPGLGDSWQVPLRHGYYFCMTDNMNEGRLMKDKCNGSPPLHSIRELAQTGDSIVGWSQQKGAFTFDMSTGKLTMLDSREAALARLSPLPNFQTAHEFYRSRRYGWQDVAALIILLGLVVGIARVWFNRFIRERTNLA